MNSRISITQSFLGIGLGVSLLVGFGRLVATPAMYAIAGNDAKVSIGPIVQADGMQCHLGNVTIGSTVKAKFQVANVGDTRLIIRRSTGGCDCGTAEQPNLVVPPGGSDLIVTDVQIVEPVGSTKIAVHFDTNDPKQSVLTVYCLANVVAP